MATISNFDLQKAAAAHGNGTLGEETAEVTLGSASTNQRVDLDDKSFLGSNVIE